MQHYTINNTAGVLKYILPPGASNGPGLSHSDTDLRTYGAGNQQWGEGYNENFYRLVENFACPESILHPGEPMDAAELGISGAGVNSPINGQLWFNSTKNKLFVYDQTNTLWKGLGGVTASSVSPSNPAVGDTWYDLPNHQLYVWEGSPNNWVAVGFTEAEADARFVNVAGDTMTGQLTLSGNPVAALDATPKQYVDTAVSAVSSSTTTNFYDKTASDLRYVNVSGDTMTGVLTLNANPVGALDAAPKQYVDTTVAAVSSNLTTNFYTKTNTDSRYYAPSGTSGATHIITISAAAPSGGSSGDIWFKL
jgi:hypothetical protein